MLTAAMDHKERQQGLIHHHAAYHTPTLCQNGPAPHQPKRTSSVPAKMNQLCASQNGPKRTSSVPAKTNQLCACQNRPALCSLPLPLFRLAIPHCRSFHCAGNLQPLRRRPPPPRCHRSTAPAIPLPPPPFFRLAVPRCRSFHRAGSLQPLRHRPPPLCRPPLPQLHRAGHLAQGLVCTGWPCSPAKCCTNPNSISQKKCYHGQFTIS
jgi:hypothetical protein